MKRRAFLASATLLPAIPASLPGVFAKPKMKIHFLRHATFFLEAGDVRLLIDPMLSAKDVMDPVVNAPSSLRIPMVELPLPEDKLAEELKTIDAVIVTHTHRDHWDAKAQELLDRSIPLISQPSDAGALREKGFENLLPVDESIEFKGLRIYRTGGRHGTGEVGRRMGYVSGFVIESGGTRLYIAGDTIWCLEVEEALGVYKPDFVVVNTGAAQFNEGGPITMTAADVVKVCSSLPSARVIAVHMDTVNHCLLTRTQLKKVLKENKLSKNCSIPADGEWITF